MALTEQKILKSVEVLADRGCLNVAWSAQILRDGELIAEEIVRKAYSEADKADFLAEVEGASDYLPILGWE